jgi:hypothetical protein
MIVEEQGFRRDVISSAYTTLGLFWPKMAGNTIQLAAKSDHGPIATTTASASTARPSINTSQRRSICAPSNAGNSSWAESRAVSLRGAHDGGSEFTRVNNRRRLRRTEPTSDHYTFGKPIEFGR